MSQRISLHPARGAVVEKMAAISPGDACVGPWKLAELLGEGRRSQVYLARPARSANPASAGYAVKLLRPELQDDDQAIACLRREALVGSQIRHASLTSILSAQVDAAPFYLVMPRLRGAALDRRMSRGQRLSLSVALGVVRQVAEALGALHSGGWMHADLKPSNIFVSPEGHATLLDLGLACRIDELHSLAKRPLQGTMAYMAPEAFTSALAPDIRSDFYSLGITLFELLAGRRPFSASNSAELARRHLSSRAPDIRRFAPHLPLEAVRFVHRLLAKEPLRRPQTPEELINLLVSLEISMFSDRRPFRCVPRSEIVWNAGETP